MRESKSLEETGDGDEGCKTRSCVQTATCKFYRTHSQCEAPSRCRKRGSSEKIIRAPAN